MAQLLSFVGIALGTLALAACVLERRSGGRLPLVDPVVERYGAFAWKPSLASALYGTFLVGAPVAVAALSGLARVKPAPGLGVVTVGALFLLLPVRFAWAAAEELMIRGALLPRAARLIGGVAAPGASSLLSALSHLERTGSRTPDLAWIRGL